MSDRITITPEELREAASNFLNPAYWGEKLDKAADTIEALLAVPGEDQKSLLEDAPNGNLADRLLRALWIQPVHAMELGDDAVVRAATNLRWQAHRFGFVAEDWSFERQRGDDYLGLLQDIQEVLADPMDASSLSDDLRQRLDSMIFVYDGDYLDFDPEDGSDEDGLGENRELR